MEISPAFATVIDACRAEPPQVAVILGSGLYPVSARLETITAAPFEAVPGLSAPSVPGHTGWLKVGRWAGQRALVFEGRLHAYEGHLRRTVVLPVQTAAFLGARILLVTNAAGGIHPDFVPGSLMAIRDHIDWARPWCWRQPGPGSLAGDRPSPYSTRLLALLAEAARRQGLALHQGLYAAVTGPCYETPAEIRALRSLEADAVGMSTAREVEAGAECSLECAAISCITNRAAGLGPGRIEHGDVLSATASLSGRLGDLLEEFLRLLAATAAGNSAPNG